ncbi:MAG: site-specific integrase, partial [Bacteroidota bacterium]
MQVELEKHRGELRIMVYFEYNQWTIQKIKGIDGVRWSQTNQCWHLPATSESVHSLLSVFPELEIPILPDAKEKKSYWGEKREDFNARKRPKPRDGELKPLTEAQKKLVEKLWGQLEMERYAYSTIKGYTIHFSHYMRYHHPKTADELDLDDIRKFMLYLVRSKKVAASTQNQAINAIKAYYEKVRKMPKIILELERPRKPQ